MLQMRERQGLARGAFLVYAEVCEARLAVDEGITWGVSWLTRNNLRSSSGVPWLVTRGGKQVLESSQITGRPTSLGPTSLGPTSLGPTSLGPRSTKQR